MDQKNRLLREAFEMLTKIGEGVSRPLGSMENMMSLITLRDRIAKNLKINYEDLK